LLWEVFMQRKPYTRYSREFKLEAVRQAPLGEKPKAQMALCDALHVSRSGYYSPWARAERTPGTTGRAYGRDS
jgi:hypothetical protein